MTNAAPAILIDGLTFPEGPRWRGDRLWFSDVLAGSVMTVDLQGKLTKIVDVPGRPSGLGWLPDGTLLVVSAEQGRLLAFRQGQLESVADMKALTSYGCNDMVVAGDGNAYVGSTGPGLDEAKMPGPGNMSRFGFLVRVSPRGQARIDAERVTFPNGAVITPDGKTLIVAETFGFRLTAFDVAPDGSLTNRRLWADLGAPPDGICLDEEGCVWVALPYLSYGGPGAYVRIAEGGDLKQKIEVEGYSAYACTLGGPDMRTLFLCESAILGLPRNSGDGRIRTVQVDVPGTGSP